MEESQNVGCSKYTAPPRKFLVYRGWFPRDLADSSWTLLIRMYQEREGPDGYTDLQAYLTIGYFVDFEMTLINSA